MAFEGERTPALPDLLDAIGLPGPNRSGGSAAVYGPGLPESAPPTTLPVERVYHTRSGEARADAAASPPHDGGSRPDACGGLVLSTLDLPTVVVTVVPTAAFGAHVASW